jgi:hypothetical protein
MDDAPQASLQSDFPAFFFRPETLAGWSCGRGVLRGYARIFSLFERLKYRKSL